MDPGILVPPIGYGGHERLVGIFAEEYKKMGHEVHLLVTEGSFIDGCTMHPFGKQGFPPKKSDALKAIPTAWRFLWKHRNDFDLIHNFGRLIYLLPLWNVSVKKIMTYGREITGSNINRLLKLPHQNLVFTGCSKNLISRSGAEGNWQTVYNAIDFSKYNCVTAIAENAPLIFLGRIEKIKGCHTAIAVAKATNNVLIIAGNISPLKEERIYFEKEIQPHIDGKQIIYVGQVNDEQKNHWLGKSKALLMPIEWNEPFGIVMIEAMACGTPVIAFKRGSVQEVVDEGITGIIVDDETGMANAVKQIHSINRLECKTQAEKRFNVGVIAQQYLKLFSTKPKKIVLITPGQPAVNPRIVKEADLLSASGYDVTLLYCHTIPWADDSDKLILANANWKGVLVGGGPAKQLPLFVFTKIRNKFFLLLSNRNEVRFKTGERAHARCYDELLTAAKKIRADYYIGHNLGAIAVCVNAANHNNAIAGFDFEDYHREEYSLDDHLRRNRIVYLENTYVPKLQYLTFASPLIQEKVLSHFPLFEGSKTTILNCFSIKELATMPPATSSKTLKLFWFSQTVGPNRGLEDVMAALMLLNDKDIELTLAGRVRQDVLLNFKPIIQALPGRVLYTGVVDPHSLHELAAEQDVGLALEQKIPENRNVCLTNKIFTYMLAGNAIIFSETDAQKQLNDEHSLGISFGNANVNALANAIAYYKDEKKLQVQKEHNIQLAATVFNWEVEGQKLIRVIADCDTNPKGRSGEVHANTQ